ncbi:MAG: glycerophosphodiester phosphodiesterase family protein [Candidatus Promineifilaceae bacterium]|nr:glycerophosphodiester phosphodiesterase family protein [Candidatus Promineifilaceae bacterium]
MSNNWMFAQGPLIIAHRGSHENLAENTLAAFVQAVEEDADGLELDVQFSADKQIVIFHDHSLERLTGEKRKVSDLSLDELKGIDLGDGLTIPTLDELLEMLGSATLYNIELKNYHLWNHGLETAVADRVESFNLENFVLISSFNPLSVRRSRRVFSRSVPVALIREEGLSQYGYLLARGDADHPHYRLVNESYMRWCTKNGYRSHVWTVNEADEAQRLLRLGVHAIITDRPLLMRQVLG